MQVDYGKTTIDKVVKVDDVNVVIKDVGKKPMVFGKSAQNDSQKCLLANDHEASSSNSASKYHQPRWCPPSLSHSQKRRLQRLRLHEQKEQEAKKLRDEYFNKYWCWHFLSRYRVCDDLGNNLRIACWRSLVQSLEMRVPTHPSNCTQGVPLSWYNQYDYRWIRKCTDIPL